MCSHQAANDLTRRQCPSASTARVHTCVSIPKKFAPSFSLFLSLLVCVRVCYAQVCAWVRMYVHAPSLSPYLPLSRARSLFLVCLRMRAVCMTACIWVGETGVGTEGDVEMTCSKEPSTSVFLAAARYRSECYWSPTTHAYCPTPRHVLLHSLSANLVSYAGIERTVYSCFCSCSSSSSSSVPDAYRQSEDLVR